MEQLQVLHKPLGQLLNRIHQLKFLLEEKKTMSSYKTNNMDKRVKRATSKRRKK